MREDAAGLLPSEVVVLEGLDEALVDLVNGRFFQFLGGILQREICLRGLYAAFGWDPGPCRIGRMVSSSGAGFSQTAIQQ